MSDFLEVHTSDRIRYKRCRRKWSLASPLRMYLEPTEGRENINLWLGTGFHFALEDYHGYNRFKDPVKAIEAFYLAFNSDQRPEDAEEGIALLMDMMEHYKNWLRHRDIYRTLWIDGKPQVEVRFALELTEFRGKTSKPVVYRGTLDRLAIDPEGRYWVQDYKTARSIDLNKLANDPQIGAYVWAAEQYFEVPIEGMLYTQFAKKAPKPPKRLVNGGLSVDKRQATTHYLYREALLEQYPNAKFPSKYIEFLDLLAEKEQPEGDEFIRLDQVHRNLFSKEKTYEYIIQEVSEMLNPDLPLYPNPTRDCSWDCTEFRPVCLAMDEGDDYEYLIKEFYRRKEEHDETWRERVKWPEPEPQTL